MPDQVLTLLKYVALALLYLFFLRVLRAVWVELREPKPAPAPDTLHSQLPSPPVSQPVPPGPMPVMPSPRVGAPYPADPTIAGVSPAGRAPPLAPAPLLTITEPAQRRGQRFAVGQETTVGRAPGCAVSLPDDTFVSQLHARVFRRDGSLWVEDLGSTNGTWVNGGKVTMPVPIHPGDRLQVGNTVLECCE